jgi:hypothetical protein
MNPKGVNLLTEEFKMDIKWWIKYVKCYNGVSMMLEPTWSVPNGIIETDSCLTGCGAVCGNQYFHTRFPQNIVQKDLQINVLEMLCIVVSVQLWSDVFQCKRILIRSDSMVSVNALNHLNTRNRDLQACVRKILYVCGLNDFQVKLVHVPGAHNTISDALSRWHLNDMYQEKFKILTKHRSMVQRNVHDHLFMLDDDWL